MFQLRKLESDEARITDVAFVNPVLFAGAAPSTVYVPLALVSNVIEKASSTFSLNVAYQVCALGLLSELKVTDAVMR